MSESFWIIKCNAVHKRKVIYNARYFSLCRDWASCFGFLLTHRTYLWNCHKKFYCSFFLRIHGNFPQAILGKLVSHKKSLPHGQQPFAKRENRLYNCTYYKVVISLERWRHLKKAVRYDRVPLILPAKFFTKHESRQRRGKGRIRLGSPCLSPSPKLSRVFAAHLVSSRFLPRRNEPACRPAGFTVGLNSRLHCPLDLLLSDKSRIQGPS